MAPKLDEASFKVHIPKFYGGIRVDSLLDWLVDVEEILDFQSVPDDCRVSLVTTKFRDHAASWWQQLKKSGSRAGKKPIRSWDELKKKLCATFLPYNYERTLNTRLQNLKHGSRSVDYYFHKGNAVYDNAMSNSIDDLNCFVADDENNDLSSVEQAYDADLKFDVAVVEDDDVVAVEDEFENDDDIVRDGHADQTQGEVINFDATTGDIELSPSEFVPNEDSVYDVKVSDHVDNVNTTYYVCDVFAPAGDGYDEDVNNKDIIGNQVVENTNLSPIRHECVINSGDEKEEDSYLDKEDHNYSIYPATRPRKIKGEPPDRGRREILLSHEEENLYNKIVMNYVVESLKPMQNLFCQSVVANVYGADHFNFFFHNGALIGRKRRVVTICVENSIIMVLLSREFMGIFYVATKSLCLFTNRYAALSTETCNRSKAFQLFFIVQGARGARSKVYGLDYIRTLLVICPDLFPPPLTLGDVYIRSQLTSTYLSIYVVLGHLFDFSIHNFIFVSNVPSVEFSVTCAFVSLETFMFLWPPWRRNILMMLNVWSPLVCVSLALRRYACPHVLLFPSTSLTKTLQRGGFQWVMAVVCRQLWNSSSISTPFICWNDVTCESRKLLPCGKLSVILAYFSNKIRFVRCLGTSHAVMELLMWNMTSILKRFNMVFDPGDFVWVVFPKDCIPLRTRSDFAYDREVILTAMFHSLYARWVKVRQENVDLIQEKMLLARKMAHIENMLFREKEESKIKKIKLAAAQNCSCVLKREDDRDVFIMRLKAALVAEKETSTRLEKELMEFKKNVRMLNNGTKNLDHILRMGRTGKAKFGLGYQGGTCGSTTVFVPGTLSMSAQTYEHPDSRPNPLPPEGS